MKTATQQATKGIQRVLAALFAAALLMSAAVMTAGSASAQALDSDGDGIEDVADNCPDVKNRGQNDVDADGIGNKCDDDMDNDGFANDVDDAPRNPAVWTDADGDKVNDDVDNCPTVKNRGQNDLDGDGIGNKCDDDIDGDGVPNDADDRPRNGAVGIDTDGDRINDDVDNCPDVKNRGQADDDMDGIGNKCDDEPHTPPAVCSPDQLGCLPSIELDTDATAGPYLPVIDQGSASEEAVIGLPTIGACSAPVAIETVQLEATTATPLLPVLDATTLNTQVVGTQVLGAATVDTATFATAPITTELTTVSAPTMTVQSVSALPVSTELSVQPVSDPVNVYTATTAGSITVSSDSVAQSHGDTSFAGITDTLVPTC